MRRVRFYRKGGDPVTEDGLSDRLSAGSLSLKGLSRYEPPCK